MSSLDRYHLVPQHFRCHCCLTSNPLAVEYSWNHTTTTTKVMIWLNRCCKTLSPVSTTLVCVDLCSKKTPADTTGYWHTAGKHIRKARSVTELSFLHTLSLFSVPLLFTVAFLIAGAGVHMFSGCLSVNPVLIIWETATGSFFKSPKEDPGGMCAFGIMGSWLHFVARGSRSQEYIH